jgi:hypothetical protein
VDGKNFDTERKIKELVNPFETNEKTRSTSQLEKSFIEQQIKDKLCGKQVSKNQNYNNFFETPEKDWSAKARFELSSNR